MRSWRLLLLKERPARYAIVWREDGWKPKAETPALNRAEVRSQLLRMGLTPSEIARAVRDSKARTPAE